jgi:hypothetical protein
MWERWPDEVRVMAHPADAYAELQARPAPTMLGALARGPLRMSLAIGAGVAFLNGGHLGPARLLPAVVCWSFVPLLRLAGLALVAALLAGRGRMTAHVIDLYAAGQGPWYAWILGLSLAAVVTPSLRPWLFSTRPADVLFTLTLALALAWSIAIRLAFFRVALGLSPARARLAVLLMALSSWTAVVGWWLASDQLLPRIE